MRRVAVVVAVLFVGLVSWRMYATASANAALQRRVAALEAADRGRQAATPADVAAVRTELGKVAARIGEVDDRTASVCEESAVSTERARLEGADSGSGYRSTAYYTTLEDLLDVVCG
jgi:hypothetical protein